MRFPIRFIITHEQSCLVRHYPSHNAKEIKRFNIGDSIDVIDKLFSETSERWVYIQFQSTSGIESGTGMESGYVWWTSSSNDAIGLQLLGFTPTATHTTSRDSNENAMQ